MGLQIVLKNSGNDIWVSNLISHDLSTMAGKAGLYYALWRPEELMIKTAGNLIDKVETGYMELIRKPDYFKQFAPKNDDTYDDLVIFTRNYLMALKDFPDAEVVAVRR